MALTESEKRALRRIRRLPIPSSRRIAMMRWHVRHHNRLRRENARVVEQENEYFVESPPSTPPLELPPPNVITVMGEGGLGVVFPVELAGLAELLAPIIQAAIRHHLYFP